MTHGRGARAGRDFAIFVLAWLAAPATVWAQPGPAPRPPGARVPGFVPETPPCTRAKTVTITGKALRPLLRDAARGVVPEASVEDLVSSCEVPRDEIAQDLNRGGLQAHRAGDYARAVRLWELALGVDPSRTAPRYNLACGYALTGRRDEAIARLEELRGAGEAGARWLVRAREDGDLACLRSDPRFLALARPAEPTAAAPSGAAATISVCDQLGAAGSSRRCAVRPGGRALPGGGRVDIVEVTADMDETTAYLVFRDGADEVLATEELATSRDVPGESETYQLGAIEVSSSRVSVSVTDEYVTVGNTGMPDEPAERVTETTRSRTVCTLADSVVECESQVLRRDCRGSPGTPPSYVRAICSPTP